MKSQSGVTFIGGIYHVSVLILVVMLVIKLTPAYYDYYSVRSVMSKVASDPRTLKTPGPTLKKRILQGFSVNNVRDLTKDNLEITKNDKSMTITVSYDKRIPLFGNIDLVIHFDDQRKAGS